MGFELLDFLCDFMALELDPDTGCPNNLLLVFIMALVEY
jgi:hypothetical protein